MEKEENALPVEERRTPTETEDQNENTIEQFLDEAYTFKTLNRGDLLKGKVVHVSPEEILIDVGWKYEGTVSNRELESLGPEAIKNIHVGDEVLTYVLNPEDKNGRVLLSLRQAEIEKEWQRLEKLFKAGEIFEATVTGYNKGGLLVQSGEVRGFVPASQLVPPPPWSEEATLTPEQRRAKMVGKQLVLKIIELDRQRNRLILSERAAQRQWRRKQKKQLLEELQEGDIRHGRVSSLSNFGAFVDLGGADGLIHLSELTWGRVSHPSEVLQVGDEVEVYVLNVDREKRRIGLSLKRLQPDPWDQIEERYSEGQLVEGTITKLTDFGAFARLKGEEIEGLIHISELSEERITHPKEVVKEGDTLTLRIVHLDPRRRRMALSLKSVAKAKYAAFDWRVEGAAMLEEQEPWHEEEGELEEEAPQVQSEEAGELQEAEKPEEVPEVAPVVVEGESLEGEEQEVEAS